MYNAVAKVDKTVGLPDKTVATLHKGVAMVYKRVGSLYKGVAMVHKTVASVHKTAGLPDKTVATLHKGVASLHKTMELLHKIKAKVYKSVGTKHKHRESLHLIYTFPSIHRTHDLNHPINQSYNFALQAGPPVGGQAFYHFIIPLPLFPIQSIQPLYSWLAIKSDNTHNIL